jgi:uracil-DNA glycosylase family 4
MKKHKDFLERRHNIVPPDGPLDGPIALVGEQPAKSEVHRRKPFVGEAGRKNLDPCLMAAGIVRGTECYITNVIKDMDAPLKMFIDIPSNKNHEVKTSNLGDKYIEILHDELSEWSGNIIVALGNVALWVLTSRRGINKWRGSILESTLLPGKKVIPTLHPATFTREKLFKNPGAYLNKHLITFDLKKAKKESENPKLNLTERNAIIRPTFQQCKEYLSKCIELGYAGYIIDYDIEMVPYAYELSCISFAYKPTEAICVPFYGPDGNYFSPEQELELMLLIAEILSTPDICKRGQNLSFDSHFMLRKYGIVSYNMHDTMIVQNTIFHEYKKDLGFICSIYTDIPYYKEDGKIWITGQGGWDEGWVYNCLDSMATADAHPKQMEDLRKQGNEQSYDRQRALIQPLTYMQERGIRVDMEGLSHESEIILKRQEKLQAELNELVGFEMNVNSNGKNGQVAKYFYDLKGEREYKKKGNVTVDDTAMKRLARKGYKEASLIKQIRACIKQRSNYVDLNKIDSDGRLRCSYNPVGTKFSRISSSANIFGTGMNLQNWPHHLLKYLIADEGYWIPQIDMSQIENRIVAVVANDEMMMKAFNENIDVHRLTAALIFGKKIDDVTTEDNTCPLGDGTHSERFWGKKSNHALNYDEGYKTFSLQMEIPETEGKWIVDRYHKAYPGVRGKFHKDVRAQLAKNRTLTNLMGRKTFFMGMWGDKLFKAAYSCIPQGTNGDKVNEHGVEFIYYNQHWFEPIELANQVHDSVGMQIPLSIPWEQQAEMLLRIKESLERPLYYEGRECRTPADFSFGFTFYKEGGVEIKSKDVKPDPQRFALQLKEAYDKLRRKENDQT